MYQLNEIKLQVHATIRQALEVIESGAMKIALIVDEHDRLMGTLTDGDIRRGLLRGLQLDDRITDLYNAHPVTAFSNDPKTKLIELAVSRKIFQIPVIDEQGKVIRLAEIDRLLEHEKHSNLVVLMAGGRGSRLKPLTDDTPKPLLQVGDRPILETLIKRFKLSGFSNFLISLNYKGEMIADYFGDGHRFDVHIEYVTERQPMGTSGSLSLITTSPNEPFFVMNADILTLIDFEDLMDFHIRHETAATMCIREYGMEVPYGVVRLDKEHIVSIEEKPVQQFYVNAGIYVLNPEILDLIPQNKQMDMTRLFELLVQKGHPTRSYPVREFWMDIGKPEDYQRANREFNDHF
ncbi:MAG: nucleotidyltransferase family protein [Bacteroidales bacterium]|nr:nucleotidyltransferase family protein [Bacteroidales bacterium]